MDKKAEAKIKKLLERVKGNEELPMTLDDLIHDLYDRMASEVCNEGPEAQLKLLAEHELLDTTEQAFNDIE